MNSTSMSNLTLDGDNPLQMFLYALRASESKRQYPRRLKVFLDYLTNKGELKSGSALEDECKEFLIKTKENPKWANGQLMEFILFFNIWTTNEISSLEFTSLPTLMTSLMSFEHNSFQTFSAMSLAVSS